MFLFRCGTLMSSITLPRIKCPSPRNLNSRRSPRTVFPEPVILNLPKVVKKRKKKEPKPPKLFPEPVFYNLPFLVLPSCATPSVEAPAGVQEESESREKSSSNNTNMGDQVMGLSSGPELGSRSGSRSGLRSRSRSRLERQASLRLLSPSLSLSSPQSSVSVTKSEKRFLSVGGSSACGKRYVIWSS